MEDSIEISTRKLFLFLGILLLVFIVVLIAGHLYPQQFDNFGDRYFGPFFYGTQPS